MHAHTKQQQQWLGRQLDTLTQAHTHVVQTYTHKPNRSEESAFVAAAGLCVLPSVHNAIFPILLLFRQAETLVDFSLSVLCGVKPRPKRARTSSSSSSSFGDEWFTHISDNDDDDGGSISASTDVLPLSSSERKGIMRLGTKD